MAGLGAAAKLTTHGYSVIVLEAQDRIGGRLKSNSSIFPGYIIDLGAQWIHGHKGNPLTRLLKEAGNSKHFMTDYENSDYFDVDTLLTCNELDGVWSDYKSTMNQIAKMQSSDEDMPLSDAIEITYDKLEFTSSQRRYTNFAVVDEIELEYGTSSEDLSMWWFDNDGEFGGSDWWIEEGYRVLPEYLAEGLDIRYLEKVDNINYLDDNITISTSTSMYVARKVIIAVPLGVLKANAISFTPQLPDEVQLGVERLFMGLLEKNFLQFDTTFWSSDRDFVYLLSGDSSRYRMSQYLEIWNIDYYLPGSHILCVFESGAAAVDSETRNDTSRVDRIMSHIRDTYPDAPDPIAYFLTSWGQDPFAYGSYSSVGFGASPTDRAVFRKVIDNKLYFAGEHTHKKYPSTAHGAYMSGEDAAEAIMGNSSWRPSFGVLLISMILVCGIYVVV